MDKVMQFRIEGTPLSYSMKLTYSNDRVLENVERQEIRRSDRSVNFSMLNQAEKNVFIDHFRDKVSKIPVTV